MAVLDEGERLGEVGLGRVEVAFEGCEACFGVRDVAADAGLLGLEEVEGDGVGVVGGNPRRDRRAGTYAPVV